MMSEETRKIVKERIEALEETIRIVRAAHTILENEEIPPHKGTDPL